MGHMGLNTDSTPPPLEIIFDDLGGEYQMVDVRFRL
jgi:hypothetical protein